MWKTALLLIFTLLIVPFLAYRYDDPLTPLQNQILADLIWTYLSAALLCFIVSIVTRKYSQVDKLWSIMPVIYSWIVYFQVDNDPRVLLMAVLVTIWGLRLSYNFYRRGGYSWKIWSGEQDYRWEVLRNKKEFQGMRWMLFNFFFISLYQMGLILLFTLPILKSIDGGPLTAYDILLAVFFVVAVILEAIADQQQWNFHKEKKRNPDSEASKKGFVHTGLWSKVRHPNYAAEQLIWILFYGFSIVATGHWINWTITGCLLLILLFKGSSDFSESISASKYPEYEKYQKKVPRFVPYLRAISPMI